MTVLFWGALEQRHWTNETQGILETIYSLPIISYEWVLVCLSSLGCSAPVCSARGIRTAQLDRSRSQEVLAVEKATHSLLHQCALCLKAAHPQLAQQHTHISTSFYTPPPLSGFSTNVTALPSHSCCLHPKRTQYFSSTPDTPYVTAQTTGL